MTFCDRRGYWTNNSNRIVMDNNYKPKGHHQVVESVLIARYYSDVCGAIFLTNCPGQRFKSNSLQLWHHMSCVFFSDVGCYLFPGTYARLTFRLRGHNFSLRGSLGVDRLPTPAYARDVLCNFWLKRPTPPQSQQHVCMIAHPCTQFTKLFMIQWSQ